MSKAWDSTETSWGIPDKEAYATIFSVKKLEYLLADRYFIIKTDHKNMTYINFEKNPKVVRWKILLQALNFDTEFTEGKKNIIADALSISTSNTKPTSTGLKTGRRGYIRLC